MTSPLLTITARPLTEITIGWGEDSYCALCLCDLPAGAPAYPGDDGQLYCVDHPDGTDPYAGFIRDAVRQAAAEILAEEPTASPEGAR